MSLQDFDCFGTIPITDLEIAAQIKLINTTIENLWLDLKQCLAAENIYAPYSDRIHPLFLEASEPLFRGTIEATCKKKAIVCFERCLELAISGDAAGLFCELLVARWWLTLGASIEPA